MYNYFGCWVKSQWQRAKFSLKDPIKTITIFSKLMKAMTKWKREDGSNADIQQPRAITNLSHQDKIYAYKIYRLRSAIATAIGTRMLVFEKPLISNYAFFIIKDILTH